MSEKLPQGNQESLADDNGWGTSAAEANRKAWESNLQEDAADTEKGFDPSAAENNRKAWENEAQNSADTEDSEASSDEENYDVSTWGGFKSDRREATELGITTESEYNEWRTQKYPQEEKVNQAERFKDKKSWRDFEDEGGTNGQEYKDWLDYKKATDPINVMKKLKELEKNYDDQRFHGTRGEFMDAKNELHRFKAENGEIIDDYQQKEAEKAAEAEKLAAEAEAKRVAEAEKTAAEEEKNDEKVDKLEFHSISEAEASKIDAGVDALYADRYESAAKTHKNIGLVMENDTDRSERAPFNDKTSKDMGYVIKVLMDANLDKFSTKIGEIVQQNDWYKRDDALEIKKQVRSKFDFINDQIDTDEALEGLHSEAENLSIDNVSAEIMAKVEKATPDIAGKIKTAQLEKARLYQAELTAQQESHDHSNERVSWGFWKKTKEFVTGSHKRKQKKLNKAVKSAKEARANFKSDDLDKFDAAVDTTGYQKQRALYNKIKKYM
ncbi:MAG: hypothetical protein KIG14_02645 [Candidatus Sacchiramonaceae bacterium]|nr:hypothetical protein [Candidatus Saccharimonadaceae bacterium]